eukprot:GHVL01018359.1.p1 GENE.GHVL01018359.1~~GHVL01018359.1.p1  ORF type:complete len:243 (+),score=47.98 GHVL01018359.1:50-778(+)
MLKYNISKIERGIVRHVTIKPLSFDVYLPTLKIKKIPVVLLQNVPGLGTKGDIVNVKKGLARYKLVPKKQAAWGTWENIDNFADPASVVDELGLGLNITEECHPFDFLNRVSVDFAVQVHEQDDTLLIYPLFEELSQQHEVDLLIHQISLAKPILTTGNHSVSVKLNFKDGARTYNLQLDVKSIANANIKKEKKDRSEKFRIAAKEFFQAIEGAETTYGEIFKKDLPEETPTESFDGKYISD